MKSSHYLTIIRKSSFIDLYKYGYIYVRQCVKFNGKVDSIRDKTKFFKKLVDKIDCFEYSFEYLMLHFIAEDVSKREVVNYRLNIPNIRAIYVFNDEAKKEMEVSLGPRIQIYISNWSKMFNELQRKLFVQQSMEGIDNIWKIFDLEKNDKENCHKIITAGIVEETIRELFDNERPIGELPVWVYLLRYERHNLYPNNIMGYFCDFIHVLLNFLDKEERDRDVEECTEVGKNLSGGTFRELIKCVEESKQFMDLSIRAESRCKLYIVAPIYLFLRDAFAENLDREKRLCGLSYDSFIQSSKHIFGFDFSVVAYLLGLTLGYDKTYEAYYDKIPLPIFKKVIKDKQPSDELESIVEKSKTEDIQQQDYEENTNLVSSIPFENLDKEDVAPMSQDEAHKSNSADIGPLFNGCQQSSMSKEKNEKIIK